MGVWAFLRVQNPSVQGHTQPTGKVKPSALSPVHRESCKQMSINGV